MGTRPRRASPGGSLHFTDTLQYTLGDAGGPHTPAQQRTKARQAPRRTGRAVWRCSPVAG